MKYFKHDLLTRDDDKIFELIEIHGMMGYGLWWVLLEELYKAEENGFQIEATDTWFKRLSKQLNLTDWRSLIRVLDTMAAHGLLNPQLWAEHIIYAPGITKRADQYVRAKHLATERKREQRKRDKQSKPKVSRVTDVGQPQCHTTVTTNTDPDPDANTDPDPHTQERVEPKESVSAFVSLTEPESKPPSVNPPQQRLEQGSAAPRYLSGAEKVNRHFAAPQLPWGDYLNPEPAFLNYLLKVYLPKVPSNKDREIGLSDARRWLNGAKYDEHRRDNALIEWESFLEWRDRPSDLNPADWEHSPKRAEYEALYNSMSLKAFLFPNLEQGDRTTPPDRQSFYNYLQKTGAA